MLGVKLDPEYVEKVRSSEGTTDAELGTILDQVLAELETSLLKAYYAAGEVRPVRTFSP